jgi:hypothetical protein
MAIAMPDGGKGEKTQTPQPSNPNEDGGMAIAMLTKEEVATWVDLMAGCQTLTDAIAFDECLSALPLHHQTQIGEAAPDLMLQLWQLPKAAGGDEGDLGDEGDRGEITSPSPSPSPSSPKELVQLTIDGKAEVIQQILPMREQLVVEPALSSEEVPLHDFMPGQRVISLSTQRKGVVSRIIELNVMVRFEDDPEFECPCNYEFLRRLKQFNR